MFKDIIGHEDVKKTLLKSANSNVNSYLFYGNSGIGKFKTAEEFSKVLLDTEDLNSCVDYKCIKVKQDKNIISVSQIRDEIIEGLNEKPMSTSKKVYVIDDADLLNKSAQNALLKTLEEPPKFVVIILVTSNISNILPTIISRVNKMFFKPLNRNDIEKYINFKNIEIENEIIDFCNGSIGLLNNILDLNYIPIFKEVDKLMESMILKDLILSFNLIKELNFKDLIICDYFEYKCLNKNKYLWINYIEDLKYRLKFNANYDIVLDSLVLKCIESE